MDLDPLLTEAQTRQQVIDKLLASRGWSVTRGNLLEELHLANSATNLAEIGAATYRAGDEFIDYVMLPIQKRRLPVL